MFCRSQPYIDELPALIEAQTGYVVTRFGKRRVVQDVGGAIPVQRLEQSVGGYEMVSPDVAAQRRLIDLRLAGQNMYILELVAVQGNAAVGFPSAVATPGFSVSGGFTLATVTCVAGEPFQYHDGQTRYIDNSILLQNTPAVATTQSSRQTGLIVSGKLRELPGRIECHGNFELSDDQGNNLQTSRQVTLPPLLELDRWLPVASLSSADVALQLKHFGFRASGGTYELLIRVRLIN